MKWLKPFEITNSLLMRRLLIFLQEKLFSTGAGKTFEVSTLEIAGRPMGDSEIKYLNLSIIFGYIAFGPIFLMNLLGIIKLNHIQRRNLYYGVFIHIIMIIVFIFIAFIILVLLSSNVANFLTGTIRWYIAGLFSSGTALLYDARKTFYFVNTLAHAIKKNQPTSITLQERDNDVEAIYTSTDVSDA